MNDEDRKTNPDALLGAIVRQEKRRARGQLRIFLGMCPGVGKTYAMLQAAQERQRSGVKVLVGVVETHERAETKALLSGLEVLPRREVEYRGKRFLEFDVDAVLASPPSLVLVDELAHSNIPGSRHPKRYHDVKELLEAGIHVYTTMNVQHLESRVDLVKQITGVAVQETVPDSFFEVADQVELVDLPPAELLKRLREGKVYLGEMAERAVEGFFQEEHLMALRELALRFTAEVVEGELHDQMLRKQISGPWQTRERILVAISHSPYSKRLIRAARRMAFNLEANWIALHVDTGETLSEEDKKVLRKNMDMAGELGAEVLSIRESDITAGIRRTAEEKHVTQILMGRPDRRWFRDLVHGGTILDKLVRETSEIDVHVLRQVRKPRRIGRLWRFRFPDYIEDISVYSNVFWLTGLVAGLGVLLEPFIEYKAVGFLFLLAVIAVGTLARRGPAIFAAILSTATWNYLFIPPRFTFYIGEVADGMMNVAYFAVALAASLLTTKIKRQSEELRQRARQTGLLYEFSRELAGSATVASVAQVTARFVERNSGGRCALLLRDKGVRLQAQPFCSSSLVPPSDKHFAVAEWVNANGKKAGVGTDTLAGSDVFCLPIRGSGEVLGVLLYFPNEAQSLSLEEESTLEAVCASTAISLERELLKAKAESLRIMEESERLYQTVLDSVSHELRTPITAIMGAASALQDDTTVKRVENRKALTEEVVKGARRLNHVVENLLDTSRLSTGRLSLRREIVELSESVENMVREWRRLEEVSSIVSVSGTENIFVSVDSKMLKNALDNLLRNAAAHSPPQAEITVAVSKNEAEGTASIRVSDAGKGIAPNEARNLFQKFYRVPGTPAGGIGLGLSIVKGIVEAHGGSVAVESRTDRTGSVFHISLPLWRESIPKV